MTRRSGHRWRRLIKLSAGATLLFLAIGAALVDRRYPWVWMYAADELTGRRQVTVDGTVHIMFAFTDHFEADEQAEMDRWQTAYRDLARQYTDADGRHPQHSWFWYFHDAEDDAERLRFLNQLSALAYDDLGEIELHMHHEHKTAPMSELVTRAVDYTQRNGGMITAEPTPRRTFAFIHGMFALDDSRVDACGVTDELILLREHSAYADFTNPSWGTMHPRMVNRHYYAEDDPDERKSHDRGVELRVGGGPSGDLFVFMGQSVVTWTGLRPRYDAGEVDSGHLPSEDRIDRWIENGLHVRGRPEWIFVRIFSHSSLIEHHEATLGEWGHRLHRHLTENYNDGTRYVLHYVSAREAYNIAKAAEAGLTGNPADFRDFEIAPYFNEFLYSSRYYAPRHASEDHMAVGFEGDAGDPVSVRLKATGVSVDGAEVISQAEGNDETRLELRLADADTTTFRFARRIHD